jgi:hypothetical protein
MSATLIQMSKKTRGLNSRTIEFMGIGREVERTIDRETDTEGNPLPKDADGKQITRKEVVTEITHEGVLQSIDEAMELVNGNKNKFLDLFAFGFNRDAYQVIADKDELDIYCVGLDEAGAKARKTAIRALAKTLPNFTLTECGEMILSAAA